METKTIMMDAPAVELRKQDFNVRADIAQIQYHQVVPWST